MPKLALKKRIRKILKTPKLLLITATILILSTTLLFANKGIWRHVSLRRDVSSLQKEDGTLDNEEAKLKSLLFGGTGQLRTQKAFQLCESFVKAEIMEFYN